MISDWSENWEYIESFKLSNYFKKLLATNNNILISTETPNDWTGLNEFRLALHLKNIIKKNEFLPIAFDINVFDDKIYYMYVPDYDIDSNTDSSVNVVVDLFNGTIEVKILGF
ncbi:hypothetical protein [Oceanisphaera ostreae]|uniref:Uncharacterized protein n=1 Tax=Oceanisphaera ostreae TaxID=914151 RepID=A0ABW3KCY3_9GAMM